VNGFVLMAVPEPGALTLISFAGLGFFCAPPPLNNVARTFRARKIVLATALNAGRFVKPM